MRIYVIGNDGITLCREPLATVTEGEIAVTSKEELQAAPLSGKRLLTLWNALPGVEKRKKVGDRAALIDELWSAIESLPEPEPEPDRKRPSKQQEVIAMLRRPEGATVDEVASAMGWQRHTVRGLFSGTLKKEARAHARLGARGTRPGLPHHRTGERMKPAIPRKLGLSDIEAEIAGLFDRSTQELRLAWRKLHRTEPPFGISRDLLIRAIAHQLQQQSYGGTGRALRRRLQTLTGEREKRGASFDPAVVLKTGTTLVRQWRGHTHAVLVRDHGFEYEGERYRSLSVIAKRITGAHWSGPRFFGLTKPAGASAAGEAD